MAKQLKLAGAFLTACGFLAAQAPLTPSPESTRAYRAMFTGHTTKAINYQHRGSTKVDFEGTELLLQGRGEAKVESKKGYFEIKAEFENLQPANKNGAEYLTYVMWAVTPEGRTANLGEVLLEGTKGRLNVTTELQVFGLVVTAEPYYAVTQPSDLIVMENIVRPDTTGKVEEIDAKYELLQRGQYQRLANPLELKFDRKQPLELYEARNAVQIARSLGADQFASETFAKAVSSLSQAEAYQSRHAGNKSVIMSAREAVQMAEDSRAISVKRQAEAALTAERQQSANREMRAESGRAAAQSETDRVTRNAETAQLQAQADSARLNREKDAQAAASITEADRVRRDTDARMAAAATDADRLRIENDARAAAAKAASDQQMAAAGSEADRVRQQNDARALAAKAASDQQMAAAGAEADRVKRENDERATFAKAETDSRLQAAGSEADRLKQENEAQRASSQIELDNAARQRVQLEKDKSDLRVLLLQQFNAVLQTRDTPRGLIVNMSDVLFDTGKFSLRPLAREKLAKVAGIVSGHPGLRLDVEGYTDSVGGDDYNQQLSEQRGESVRDYLTNQGMAAASVSSKGFGKNQPVASNDTAEGRQQNRRVELVISGDVIGTEIGKTIAIR